jgi:O-acetyl-ADP-ribose deacetylase (regulator of RNase III)
MKINYVFGDATAPQGDGKKIIVHVCNDIGAWGAGFVMALSRKWTAPEKAYRALKTYILGNIQLVTVEDDITICNLIGQENTMSRRAAGDILPPVRYVAIEAGLKKLAKHIGRGGTLTNTVHMPRIGSGLAGGNWKIIETIINETLINEGIAVTVYDLP